VTTKDFILPMPSVVYNLWSAQQAVAKHYSATGLKFTLDGRLVGDIAEALVREHFDLLPPKTRTGGVDAVTRSGKTVQVKATGKEKTGAAFTPGKGYADHLFFLRINFEANTATVIYNGPEAPIRKLLPKGKWTGTRTIPLAVMQTLAKGVSSRQSIRLKSTK
jgi:hypothetical protein